MTLSVTELAKKSTAELQAIVEETDAEFLAQQRKVRATRKEAARIIKEREATSREQQELTRFTDRFLNAIAKSDKKSPLEISISPIETDSFFRSHPDYSRILDAISKRFKATIKIKYDDGGDSGGGYGDPRPSAQAVITFNQSPPEPKPEDQFMKTLLRKIARA